MVGGKVLLVQRQTLAASNARQVHEGAHLTHPCRILAAMFLSPSSERERELRVSFYNVGIGIFTFSECRRFRNVEHGNENVGHVPVPGC